MVKKTGLIVGNTEKERQRRITPLEDYINKRTEKKRFNYTVVESTDFDYRCPNLRFDI